MITNKLNFPTPMTDQDRVCNNNSRAKNSDKYKLGDYQLIQFQILQTSIIKIVWQTVKKNTNEILGMKRLMVK